MRGIGMAEVAEMDLLMEETLERVFQSSHEGIVAAKCRTMKQLRESKEDGLRSLDETYGSGGLSAIVADSRLCSSFDKYRAVNRVARQLGDKPGEALEVLSTYEEDIIRNRNMLAHVKEETKPDGTTTLRSVGRDGGNVVIDDGWMEQFRRQLRAHRTALTTVCGALDREFGVADTEQNLQEQ